MTQQPDRLEATASPDNVQASPAGIAGSENGAIPAHIAEFFRQHAGNFSSLCDIYNSLSKLPEDDPKKAPFFALAQEMETHGITWSIQDVGTIRKMNLATDEPDRPYVDSPEPKNGCTNIAYSDQEDVRVMGALIQYNGQVVQPPIVSRKLGFFAMYMPKAIAQEFTKMQEALSKLP